MLAGPTLIKKTQTRVQTRISYEAGPIDYALLLAGEVTAVVEAKEEEKDAYAALTQEKRYAEDISIGRSYGRFRVPFVFTANSKEAWFQDVGPEAPRERKLRNFHRPDGLDMFLNADYEGVKQWLEDTQITDSDPNLWDNQREAIESIEEGLADNKRRVFAQIATRNNRAPVV